MNPKIHQPFAEIVALYAAGALDRQERQALEGHLLTGCAACHAAFKDYRAVAGLLPYGLSSIIPPPILKVRLMDAIVQNPVPATVTVPTLAPVQETVHVPQPPHPVRPAFSSTLEQADPTPSSQAIHPAIIPLLVMLILGAGAYALFIRSKMETEIEHRQRVERALREEAARVTVLQQQITEQERSVNSLREEFAHGAENLTELRDTLIGREADLAQLRAELAQRNQEMAGVRRGAGQRDEMFTLLRSPNVKPLLLTGLESAKSAGALLLVEPESRKALFYAFNLSLLPPGKTYQLWAMTDNGAVSLATFTIDAGQKARVIIRNLPELTFDMKLAVSMEPEGGRPQPTGAFYLTGQP